MPQENYFKDNSSFITEEDKRTLLETVDVMVEPNTDRGCAMFLAWPPLENENFVVALLGKESLLRNLLVEAMMADSTVAMLIHSAVAMHTVLAEPGTVPQVQVQEIKINKN